MPEPVVSAVAPARVVLVTGPSGAGRATAVNVLEDLQFEAIDNLPLSLIPRLLDGPPLTRTLVLGIDARNREFSVQGFLETVEWLRNCGHSVETLYLDCRAEVLLRRYSETRRRHPMAPEATPQQGIERELELLDQLRGSADRLIDTSDLTPHDLRDELIAQFSTDASHRMATTLHSFSYKRGQPRGIDTVYDCRFLNNPYWKPELRALDGRDQQVQLFVAQDARFPRFFEMICSMTEFLLPAYQEEGKAHLSLGFGCTGGQHRSVSMVEQLADVLAKKGHRVLKRHHELERRAASTRFSAANGGAQ